MADTKVTDLTEDTAPQPTDVLISIDDPGGTPLSKKAQITNLFKAVTNLTAFTDPATGDEFLGIDGGASKKITFSNYLKVVAALTAITSLDDKDDELLVYDNSVTTPKKITLGNASLGTAFTETVTLSTGDCAATSQKIIVAAESGTADTLDTLNVLSNYQEVYLFADAGDTITVTHNSGGTGDVILGGGVDIELSEKIPLHLIKVGGEWFEMSGPVDYAIVPLAFEKPADATATGTGLIRIEPLDRDFVIRKFVITVETASTSGTPTVDLNDDGSTMLSTKATIDINETSSETAATAPVLSSNNIAADSELTLDIDVAGTGTAGLNAYAIGYFKRAEA